MLNNYTILRNIITTISLLLLFHLTGYSQQYVYCRGQVSFNTGVAIPAYQFGSSSGNYLTSYANIGLNFNGDITYFYTNHVGISFMLNYNLNGISESAVEQSYLYSNPSLNSVSISTGSFHDFSGLFGMVFDIPVVEYVSLDLKIMMGLRNFYKPGATITATSNSVTEVIRETHANDFLLALLFSIGSKIELTEVINLQINATYSGSKMELDYITNSVATNQKVHIGILSLNVGVSYRF